MVWPQINEDAVGCRATGHRCGHFCGRQTVGCVEDIREWFGHKLMRTQLAVEIQDLHVAISVAERQLALLRTSVNGSAEGETEA